MQPLWSYQDFVSHLNHSNSRVRTWAFEIVKDRFPRRYTPEVAELIGDQDQHLGCAAPRYLAQHGAIGHAPAILKSFVGGEGNVPSNCAIALGHMQYEPAVDDILNRLSQCENANTFLGILHYLGQIRRNDCHNALRDILSELSEHYFLDIVAFHLLEHRDPEDVPLVIEAYLENSDPSDNKDMFLSRLMEAVGARSLFDALTEHGSVSILEAPSKALRAALRNYPLIDPESGMIHEIVKLINGRQYGHLATSLTFDTRDIVRLRSSEHGDGGHLSEISDRDTQSLAFLEEFSKRSSVWEGTAKAEKTERKLVSALVACYLSILERQGYIRALDPSAPCEDLIQTLKASSPELPKPIQDRIIQLAPIAELKEALTKELFTWGDIWTVRLMGKIGGQVFVPELIRVVQKSDGLSHIHANATEALNGMDESGHESLMSAIEEGQLKEAWDIFPLLEHLPYPESFEIALGLWKRDEMDSFEIYATCLERIGDSRGIEALQEIFFDGNAVFIGDSLEVLSLLHGRDIPEMGTIHRERKADLERRRRRRKEFNELIGKAKEHGSMNQGPRGASVVPFRREVPKVGRNDPCPCGSGKKYKKCCLNKKH
jgi:hypothetical protein